MLDGLFTAIQPLDSSILFAIQSWHNPVLDFFMPIISFISYDGYMWVPIGLLLFCFRRTRKTGLSMGLTFILCFAIGMLLKGWVARPRPTDLYPDIALLVDRPDPYESFPSGHTIMSFGMAVCLWFQGWKYGLPATIFACLVGFSRLYLFCHNPSDVIASVLFGLAAALVSTLVIHLIFRRFWNGPRNKPNASGGGRRYA